MTNLAIENTTRAALLDSQRRILDRIASGAPLAETLNTLVGLIEEQAEGMRCAVLLADSACQSLSFVAAPSIPEDYKAGIVPYLRIAPNMGSCGTAAFLREPVYTEDTGTDVLWEDCRDIAVRNSLRAIWSTPILGDNNAILGTFAMYYGEPRLPSPEHIQLIDMAVQMARVAIEAKRSEEALRKSDGRLRVVIDTIPAMAWSVLPDGTVDFLNQRWLDYAGVTLEQSIEDPMRAVHSEDIPRVLEKWRAVMASGESYEDELRLRRADGEYRWFLIRTVPLRDNQGNIVKWYGTSSDIEDRKRAEDTLRSNQAFFAAEAQRIGRLLETATPGHRLEHSAGDEDVAADQRSVAGPAPPGAGVAERTIPDDRRLISERQAIESLTSNERAIMRLITDGKPNAEVAEVLHLSPRTVETYRARLMEKLQVKDLVALVKLAIRHGMTAVD
jgi:PAS domain S-box-containing protein